MAVVELFELVDNAKTIKVYDIENISDQEISMINNIYENMLIESLVGIE